MKKGYLLLGVGLILALLTVTFAVGHDEELSLGSSCCVELSYEEFRSDLVGRNYELDEKVLRGEFYVLEELAEHNPDLSYQELFDTYYSLRIFFLEDYVEDNVF